MRNYLIRGTAGSFLLQLAATGLGFLTHLLLARLLGAEEYGVYTYVFAWVSLLVVLSRFGSSSLLMRETAAYVATGRLELAKGLLSWVGKWSIVISLLVASTASIAAWLARQFLNPLVFPAIWIGFASIPLMTLAYLTNPAMTGFRHVVLGKVPGSLVRWPLYIVSLVAVYWLNNQTLNSALAATLNIVVFVFVLVLALWFLYSILPKELLSTEASFRNRYWLLSVLPLLFVDIFNELYIRTPTIMLETLEGSEQTGVFGITYLITGLGNFIMLPLIFALSPVVSTLYTSREMVRLQRIITTSTRGALSVAFIATTGLIILRQWISALLGSDYAGVSSLLVILSIGQLLMIALGPVIILLTMTGHERDVALSLGIFTVLNIVMNFLLIQQWGIYGAGFATASVGISWYAFLSIQVYRRLQIDSTAFGLFRYNS